MLMKLSTLTFMMTPFMKHPMSLGWNLITQTILLTMIMSFNSTMSWYSYILFITMIGGLMIMFIYMSSIASNEKFKILSMKKMMMMTMILMMMMIIKPTTMEIFENMESNKMIFSQKEQMKSTSMFFNKNKMNMTIMIMMLLLLTMISVTNITNSFEGPLKKTYV